MQKAKKLHELLQETGGFNPSPIWIPRFKARYGIQFLKISGEKLSADISAVHM